MLAASRLLLAFAFLATAASAQDPAGEWSGQIDVPGAPLRIEVVLEQDDGEWSGTIAIPQQNLFDFDLAGVEVDGREVAFRMDGIPGTPAFNGELDDDGTRIEGSFLQGGATLTFHLERAEAAAEASSEADRAALEGFLDEVQAAMDSLAVPGLGLAIVRGDEVLVAQGIGLREVENDLPVTADTAFPIGSATKAFTAAVIGTLVDDGVIEWDTPVAEYMPDFRLADATATSEMTPLDLLVHTSGLPRHDIVWYAAPGTREEIFQRLRHLEPTAAFRGRWQYQNLMYLTAGLLAERVTGSTWEDLTRERLFEPLGMASATLTIDEMTAGDDFATGYGGGRDDVEKMDYYRFGAVEPAGSINAGASDIARWLSFQFGNGGDVLSSSTLRYLQAPAVVVAEQLGRPETPYLMYAPGWFVEPYRGHRMVQHGGNIDGFSALVGFLPDEEIGVAILTNKNATPLPRAVMLSAFDRLIDADRRDWLAEVAARPPAIDEDLEPVEDRIEGTSPSHTLADYVGTYSHPAYGAVTVSTAHDSLHIAYHDISGTLEHVHYDTFKFEIKTPVQISLRTTFYTNPDGVVDRLDVPLELTSDPISFERIPDEGLMTEDYLAEFAGRYEGAGLTFIVDLQGEDRLMLTVIGQSTWRLQPTRTDAFDVEGLPGFSIRFGRENGQVEYLIGNQPGASYRADRVED